ncbi:MAG: glycosyltransferase [Nanoarchaeota archaeon]
MQVRPGYTLLAGLHAPFSYEIAHERITMESKADMVCEVSWEVTNKCGGIYTVVSSKAKLMQAHYDTYYFIGPLFDRLPDEFIPSRPPESLSRIFDRLSKKGIRCEYGYWDIDGNPSTILIDSRVLFEHVNDIKEGLWDSYSVDSLLAGYDFDEPLIWSWGVGMFLEELEAEFSDKMIVGHFHEWMSGLAMMHLNNISSCIATVFTTHATMLGRSLSARGTWLFDVLDTIDPGQEAKAVGISEKFTTERACAHLADVFSTVSSSTAVEATHILGREPIVLPNGLPLEKYPTFEQASTDHTRNKRVVQDYLMAHFFPYIDPETGNDHIFDFNDTVLFYTSGRYEFENKGLDVTIDALGKLNDRLKDEGAKKDVIVFFLVAVDSQGPKAELLENKNYIDELSSRITDQTDLFVRRFVMNVLSRDDLDVKPMPDDFLDKLKREYWSIKRRRNPPLTTHIIDEDHDAIVNACRRNGLVNDSADKVKIVFVPAYLNGRDGLLNMEYYDVVSACHLGIFPSYYEPWGYTPLESIAHGVPAVTTDLAGFGQYMRDKAVDENAGLHIIKRSQNKDDVVSELYDVFRSFYDLDTPRRVNQKINAHALATYADWRQLVRHYFDAHTLALKNRDVDDTHD